MMFLDEPDMIGDTEARCMHAGPLDGMEVAFLAGVDHMLRISAPLALICIKSFGRFKLVVGKNRFDAFPD